MFGVVDSDGRRVFKGLYRNYFQIFHLLLVKVLEKVDLEVGRKNIQIFNWIQEKYKLGNIILLVFIWDDLVNLINIHQVPHLESPCKFKL